MVFQLQDLCHANKKSLLDSEAILTSKCIPVIEQVKQSTNNPSTWWPGDIRVGAMGGCLILNRSSYNISIQFEQQNQWISIENSDQVHGNICTCILYITWLLMSSCQSSTRVFQLLMNNSQVILICVIVDTIWAPGQFQTYTESQI